MICPSCGNDVANNSIMCPICGEAVTRRYDLDTDQYSAGFPNISPSYDVKPAKKSNNMTPLIIVLFLIIAAVGVGFYVSKDKKYKELHKYDGTYRLYSITMNGQTMTTDEFQEAGFKTNEVRIVIKGNKADFEGWESIGSQSYGHNVACEIKDGKITFDAGPYYYNVHGTIAGDILTIDNTSEDATIEFRKDAE